MVADPHLMCLTTVLRDNNFPYARVPRKQNSREQPRKTPEQNGVRTEALSFSGSEPSRKSLKTILSFSLKERNVQLVFSKCLVLSYAQFLIFLNIHQHRSPDNFFSKSVRQILKYFSKFPFLIFSSTCKNLSYRFLF